MCSSVAKLKRMSDTSTWHCCQILASYSMWKEVGFGAQRISNVLQLINEKEEKWYLGDYDVEEARKRIAEKYNLKFGMKESDERTQYSSKFVTMIAKKKLESDNEITVATDRFLIEFFDSLSEIGFAEKRMTKIQVKMFALYKWCNEKKGRVIELREELKNFVGIEIELPKDYAREKEVI